MSDSIVWGGDDPFTHMLCVGPTRCGKTATILKPIIYQSLLQKKKGKKLGLSIIEPKGDLARDVKEYCDEMDIPYVYIDPESEDSHHFNVMEGNTDDVAEATVAVLQSLFGKQEAFFQTIQELSTRNITKLLKEIHGDDMDLIDVLVALRDEHVLREKVALLKLQKGNTDLVEFFENELLGSLGEKYRQLVIGLRAQLENITGNEKLRKIITGKSDINIDEHFEKGGVLIVNTALGTLKKAGDAFGQFVSMHLQSGTFRRKGTEQTRIPHFIVTDEYSRYINPDIEMFLSIAASYRVAGIFATQSLGQLEVEAGKIGAKAMKKAILTSCRNKIAFSGLSAEDAKEFAEEFGKDKVVVRQSTFKNRIILPKLFPDNYRDTESEEFRFTYTYLQDGMKRFHYIARLLHEGTPQKPIEGVGEFVPRDWKERKEWDVNQDIRKPKLQILAWFNKKNPDQDDFQRHNDNSESVLNASSEENESPELQVHSNEIDFKEEPDSQAAITRPVLENTKEVLNKKYKPLNITSPKIHETSTSSNQKKTLENSTKADDESNLVLPSGESASAQKKQDSDDFW
ncbi:type IV secretory system conjugative DNA transfer family protein [Ornithinibacillus contaminans]|uniref:type IV secretory system conjugative DNA transfer family protein n=1 Tax=Ornithinibacillus contaminans TaxID=694055 RepID=UPI00069EE3AF|nr:TraM recognition domain-containing protein [Ornithinibacillus contaminans]